MLHAAAVCIAAAVLMLTHNARKRSLHHGKESHTVRQLTISWPPAVSPSSVSAPVIPAQKLDSFAEMLAHQQADRHSIRVSVLPTISEECDMALQSALLRMLPGSDRLLGLDAEWDSTVITTDCCPLALLQLSTVDECLLVQMEHLQGAVPLSLIQLLEDPSVLKVGLGIAEDVRRLQLGFGIVVKGAVDIGQVASSVLPSASRGTSLRSLTQSVLGLHLDKTLQCSAWGEQQLTDAQVTYAAHDAWASRQTLIALVGPQLQRQQQEPESRVPLQHADAVHGPASPDASSPIAVAPADETTQLQSQDLQSPATQKPKPSSQPDKILSTTRKPKSEPLYDFLAPFVLKTSSSGVDSGHTGARGTWMQQRLQRNMKQQPAQSEQAKQQQVIMQDRGTRHTRLTAAAGTMAANLPGDSSTRSHELSLSEAHSQGGGPSLLSPMKVSGGRRKEVKALGKQPVLYDNCSIQAPDGQLLCTCSIKKARWYLSMGLATEIAAEPLRIQLNFEPQGRNASTDAYETTAKSNHCCVCGADDDYGRHAVVPRCYRQHFPLQFKSHMAHDILPMCRRCEQRCSSEDHRRMKTLGVQYDAPLDVVKFTHNGDLGKVRSAARALLKSQGRIPPGRQAELMLILQQHFNVDIVDEEMIQSAAEEDPRIANTDWSSHAEVVVAALDGSEAIEMFVRGWRQHFLDTMLPTHLPQHWSVTARVCMDNPQSCVKTDRKKGPPGGESCWTGASL